MLFLLRSLHDVQGANKSALYRNASEKGTLDALIERNFIEEVPTPFSNKRTCVITERGKVLFEALTVVDEIWASKPDSEIIIRISNTRDTEDTENSHTEPIAKTDNGDSEVSGDLDPIEEPATAPADDSAPTGDETPDANVTVADETVDSGVRQQTLEELPPEIVTEDDVADDASQEEAPQDAPQEEPAKKAPKKTKKKEASE
jgi:hypothetical protein